MGCGWSARGESLEASDRGSDVGGPGPASGEAEPQAPAAADDAAGAAEDVADAAHPRLLATLSASAGIIYDVSFSPDGQTLATANTDATVSMWNIADPAEPQSLGSLTGPGGTVFSFVPCRGSPCVRPAC
jgi:hypothetical protein